MIFILSLEYSSAFLFIAFALSTRENVTMLVRSTVLLCALAVTAVARADDVRQLTLGNMHSGSRFEISTADRVYRAELIDPATGETRLAASRDGVQFSQP